MMIIKGIFMKYIYYFFISIILMASFTASVFAEDCSHLDQLIIEANAGNANSQNKLGDYYNFATCVKLDRVKALYWYQKSANAGNSNAQTAMGLKYALPSVVKRDPNKAIDWWEKAANNGNVDAMTNLGSLYQEGEIVPQDLSKATYWYDKAFQIIQAHAQEGNLDAMSSMGDAYAQGQGVTQDYSQAFYWWKKAADAGNLDAMYSLGHAYLAGDGVDMDYHKAIYWFQKAADAGDPIAMYYLGQANEIGAIEKADYSKAFYWFQKSAEKGGRNAVYELAKLSEAGVGTKRNLVQAQIYYKEACSFDITAACVYDSQIDQNKKNDNLLNSKNNTETKWYTYHNPISEYQITIPDFFVLQDHDNTNQQIFLAKNGGKILITQMENNKDSKLQVTEFLNKNHTSNDINITYNFHHDNWGVFSGTEGNDIFYNKFIISNKNNILIFELIYPKSLQNIYNKFIKKISTSFTESSLNIKEDE